MYQKCIMRIEIILFVISSFIIANIYTDGNILKKALSFKKYYQMTGVAIGTLFIYYLVKKNPQKTREILIASNDYIKYLPIDKSASDMISPIINFTTKSQNPPNGNNHIDSGSVVTQNGGVVKTKRSVSETKKKFVASRQIIIKDVYHFQPLNIIRLKSRHYVSATLQTRDYCRPVLRRRFFEAAASL